VEGDGASNGGVDAQGAGEAETEGAGDAGVSAEERGEGKDDVEEHQQEGEGEGEEEEEEAETAAAEKCTPGEAEVSTTADAAVGMVVDDGDGDGDGDVVMVSPRGGRAASDSESDYDGGDAAAAGAGGGAITRRPNLGALMTMLVVSLRMQRLVHWVVRKRCLDGLSAENLMDLLAALEVRNSEERTRFVSPPAGRARLREARVVVGGSKGVLKDRRRGEIFCVLQDGMGMGMGMCHFFMTPKR